MQVAREQQAMQIVGRGRPRRQAEERGAEVFDALAILAAEIDVASRRQPSSSGMNLSGDQKSIGQ